MNLDALLNQPIPGGCPDCNAIQSLTAESPGIYALNIEHDDSCPTYRSLTNGEKE